MNKTALKNFAINARKELIEKIKAKAYKIGITEESIKKVQFESSDAIYIDGKQLSSIEKKQREKLISRIKEIGYKQVVEEVAYTWFNRFTALRFMEVNNYLPTKVRILSSTNNESSEPDIIKEALTVDLDIDKELVYELKLNNKTEELFKYLVIKQCNSLNKVLPFMFEMIDDYKEILYPDGLLAKDSFLREMTDVTAIPETDWEQVEIIGWLYQFYIADEKDRVFKAKKRYKTEEIPFATQLFTPNWIVQYMVQNSLGRYWLESHPNDIELVENWSYYIKSRDIGGTVEHELTHYIEKDLRVEDIKCFDPAMGSGHILVYMFDLLFEIYRKCGYMDREIPKLILENNLYGLDVDDRAYQLACFSVVMKAMQYNNRLFRIIEKDGLNLNLASIQETNFLNDQDIEYFAGESNGSNFKQSKEFITQFINAKSYGSLLKITVDEKSYSFLKDRLNQINTTPASDIFMVESRRKIEELLPLLLKQSEIMSLQFNIIVTNPPYMGNKFMNEELLLFLEREYPNTKYDTFASFMEIDHYLKQNSFFAMINQHSWMFLTSYEKLRKKLLNQKTVSSMVHLGTKAFEEIGGEIVQSTAFVLRNYSVRDYRGEYVRLVEMTDSKAKEIGLLRAVKESTDYRFSKDSSAFNEIPGSPIAYWVSEKMVDIFNSSKKLTEYADPKAGLQTGDNNRFLRLWTEVDINKIGFNKHSLNMAITSGYKWFPYNKGGGYRKWYGNNEYIVDWNNDGYEIRNFKDEKGKLRSRPQNIQYYFKEGLTWSDVSTTNLGVRYSPQGFIFDVKGSTIFIKERDNLEILLAFLCTKIVNRFLEMLNPTVSFQVGDLSRLPIIVPTDTQRETIKTIVTNNIQLAKEEWDSFEISWDFTIHPLLKHKKNTLLRDSFENWKVFSNNRFSKMKSNEEQLNSIFIEMYNLQENIAEFVSDDEITLRRADEIREIKSFISYAVGCILGRYSLDKVGLIYAGGGFDLKQYQIFQADKDNVLPILSGDYLDDIVSKFIEFLKVAFGDNNFLDNFEYIANSLDRKDGETAKETIRRYLLNDFFKDHLQVYGKKPIYWLFTSGKQKAFNCLIYMHRYDKSTLSRIRTDYLHELQLRLDAEKKSLLDIINGVGTTKEISNAKKELKSLDLKIEELRSYDEKLHHMADMQIEIDLDDGVAVNYAKFEGLLAPIK